MNELRLLNEVVCVVYTYTLVFSFPFRDVVHIFMSYQVSSLLQEISNCPPVCSCSACALQE